MVLNPSEEGVEVTICFCTGYPTAVSNNSQVGTNSKNSGRGAFVTLSGITDREESICSTSVWLSTAYFHCYVYICVWILH